MSYYRKLSGVLLAGAIVATSTVGTGTAFAADSTSINLLGSPVQAEHVDKNKEVEQSDVSPDIKKIKTETDEIKTIKLDSENVNLLGASWSGEDPELKIRYKTNDSWSSWENLPEDDEGGPDLNSNEGTQAEKFVSSKDESSTEAVPVLNSNEVQLKSMNKKADTDNLEITRVSTDVTQADKEIVNSKSTNNVSVAKVNNASVQNAYGPAMTANSASAEVQTTAYNPNEAEIQQATYNSGLKANIVTRKEWGANESLKRCASSSTSSAKAVFVHHTAGSNTYTKAQAPGIIRGYLSYHTQSKGWCDLGYNFLVDKYGTIYEGRAGSITKAMTGAHASGFNSGTIGVSVLGTYTSSAPSTAAQNSVKRIIAWKSNQYGLNPTGKVTLTSGGGGTSKYGAGKKVSLNVVSGHRDTSYTECPGLAFYNKLPSIRTGAKSLQASLKDSNAGSGGSTNPTPKVTTKGAIGTFYNKNKTMTGAPTANEKKLTSPNGYYQTFKNGKVYYSTKSKAHFVKYGTFNNAYKTAKYEKGYLGYPTSEIKKFKYRSGGTYQNFEKGMITYSKQTGAQVMTTTMLTKWKSLKWERSVAKLPTKSMSCGLKDGGCYQQFEGGKLHWSKKSGVHFTKDKAAIQNAWVKAKGTSGKLGYPTTEEFKSGSKIRQNFTGGYITYTKKTGAKVYYSKK